MGAEADGKKIKVLVIDDSIFRRVLATAVEGDSRLELIGTAADAFKAVDHRKSFPMLLPSTLKCP